MTTLESVLAMPAREVRIWGLIAWLRLAQIRVVHQDDTQVTVILRKGDAVQLLALMNQGDRLDAVKGNLVRLQFMGPKLHVGQLLVRHKQLVDAGDFDDTYATLLQMEENGGIQKMLA